ncbi:hypothetical protein JTB14_027516 [Gonioctena quinquepunctata]|nr:hypothetical protein JTB14_027516 [Gonioctena quinquepunctata]
MPKNVRRVRSFQGLVNWYRRFIPNAAYFISDLTNLTKKDVKFELTPTVLEAIQKLKDTPTSEMVLIFPDFTQPFIVASDASGSGVGIVLSQIRKGYERPIAYASRSFKKVELNYSTTEKELLGVVSRIQTSGC